MNLVVLGINFHNKLKYLYDLLFYNMLFRHADHASIVCHFLLKTDITSCVNIFFIVLLQHVAVFDVYAYYIH
jgi:hypothetical protein